VPALALLFAIGRGFGFQKLLQDELYSYFPAQHEVIHQALGFVDSYLSQASEGLFVGVGLVFLLWTLISLLGNVEGVFNMIWGVKQGRSIWRKITDYTSMLLILPVLMICSGGLSVLISTTLDSIFHFSFMTPVISLILDGASWVLTFLFFTAAYMLIPNAKVKFKNAFIAGVFAGIGFRVLQWIFVSGQMYVAKYNAIYGSFSFLPLMLIWMQLAWMVTMAGMVICYSSQNIFQFSFNSEISSISLAYKEKVSVAVASVVVNRFVKNLTPVTMREFMLDYGLPSRLINDIVIRLELSGIINRVILDEKKEEYGFQPAMPTESITVGLVRKRLRDLGRKDFIPGFDRNFPGVEAVFKELSCAVQQAGEHMLLRDIEINPLNARQRNMNDTDISIITDNNLGTAGKADR
ncbi:MAG: YihY/virulence factor BrkB family protein, partial [Muribaculaceae bacterium]|nr:YihY/virulence factor BrkB family protein [Muribaculaceae bacterium]